MPTRRTKRGADRTPLGGERDVLICGASFAGLAVARELAGSGASVLVVDRYAIGERQTFDTLVIHTPHTTARMRLPWAFSTFDYGELCGLLWDQSEAEFDTAKVEGRSGTTVHTDRGDIEAPLVVDALGWRRILAADGGYQPPDAPLSRGLEVHPWGTSDQLEIWIDRDYVPAGYGWSFPAADEVRVGVGSFDPRHHVKEPTVRLAGDLERGAVRYQGNWIPHRLRPAAADGVFFAGDSAGHCLPLTAEGIRTAFYFGIACGRELRAVVEGRTDRKQALRDYAAFSASHRWKFEAMLHLQRLVPRVPPRLLAALLRGMERRAFVDWSFGHDLAIAPPEYATPSRPLRGREQALRAAA